VKVVLDAHMLGKQEGGNETYVAGLLAGLRDLALPDVAVTALVDPGIPGGQIPSWSGLGTHRLRSRGNLHRLLHGVGDACRLARADILHMTYHASFDLPCILVLSVHDVLFKRFPAFFSPRDRLLLNTLLPLSIRRAARVLTLSEASRTDIEHFFPSARGRIDVIPLAAGSVVGAPPDLSAAREISGERSYILAVGTIQPRKNFGRLVQAFGQLEKAKRGQLRLVVVGKPQWRSNQVRAATGGDHGDVDVVFAGYVSDSALAGLYRMCSAFVYPSLAEGFGLPVLEAMACGAPVITSNVSSLVEVAGDAALLVDPRSVGEIAGAMGRVLEDPGLADELRDRGRQQALRFSWANTARMTVEAYRRALNSRPAG